MFFSGKGGVGKTTCAAAAAVAAASRGGRILVVSTDPAHSLGDALDARLAATPRPIRVARSAGRGSGMLYAAEVNAPRAFTRWLGAHREAVAEIVEGGTWLDREDVDRLLSVSIPGVDELVGLIEITRLAADGYDHVIVDTAPTGHTLRLLNSPETVAAVARVLDGLYERHRFIRDRLARVSRFGAADHLIELLAGQARDTAALLRDRRRAAFRWVMLPEELALRETADGIAALGQAEIAVAGVVINRVVPAGPRCPVCDRRRAAERRVIERIRRSVGRRRTLSIVPARSAEPKGVAALRPIGDDLSASAVDRPRPSKVLGDDRARDPTGMALSAGTRATHVAPESLEALRGARLLFVGGKGGVGKTTVAATLASRLARSHPDRAVLLLSTDPAHSLADVFDEEVGDDAVPLRRGPRNLRVRELDAAAALASRRADIGAALDEISEALGAQVGGATTLGTGGLLDLAPPGVDELFGLVSVLEARQQYSLIVVDTAPTGHALRLLEMPDAAREWVQSLLRIVMKYRSLVRPGRLGAELVELSRAIREFQALMRDPEETRFVVVTRAAAVPRLETERLFRSLRRLRIAAPIVVVNAMTLGPGRCPTCRRTAAAERRQLAAIRAGLDRSCAIIQAPLAAPPPRGLAALERWANSWAPVVR